MDFHSAAGRGAALLRVAALAAVCLLLLGASPFRPGPAVFDRIPEAAGAELGFVARPDAAAGRWPPAVLERLAAALASGDRILVVGQTDPIGPRALNHSLGLQFAADAARRLSGTLGAAATRFGVASRGEVGDEPPGVVLRRWRPPPEEPPPVHLALLEPLPGAPGRGQVWGVWQGAPPRVLWAQRSGGRAVVWEVPPFDQVLRLPAPAGGAGMALAVAPRGGAAEAVEVAQEPPEEDPALRLRVAVTEPGWVSARLRVPAGYREPVVWAAGIPYPVVPDGAGDAEVALARIEAVTVARAQAVGPDGNAVVGPPLTLPDDGGLLPQFVAVLVWDGDAVDLDLHAWDRARHTHLASPDAAYSDAAVPGVRLLFDGDGWRPAAAVAGWGRRPPELEARCYSDLSGAGARAWLYVVDRPGDPLDERRAVFGPRQLSERPTEARWPALRRPAVAAR